MYLEFLREDWELPEDIDFLFISVAYYKNRIKIIKINGVL